MKNLFILLCIPFTLFANDKIFCAHQEICKLTDQILSEHKSTHYQTELISVVNGDPHEFEPTPSDIKKVVSAKILINAHKDLNPWIYKMNPERLKDKSKITFNFELKEKFKKIYLTNNTEALSHFWLYPQIYCDYKFELEFFLKKHNIISANGINNCNSNIESRFKDFFRTYHMPIIITHDALEPLFKSFNYKKIISLKGSGHHQEIDAKKIKEVYKYLNEPKAVWLLEKNITLPLNIKKLIRKSDLVINVETESTLDVNSHFSILNHILDSLIKGQ